MAWVVVAVELLPLGGAECATCVPFGDVEWHNQEALHRAGHQRQLRSNKHAFGDLVQPFKWARDPLTHRTPYECTAA